MVELLCGIVFGVLITAGGKAGLVAIRDEFSIGGEDKTDSLAKSVGKKINVVPRHYEVKDIPAEK